MAALGAAWWLYGDGLTAEERRLVGTWRHSHSLVFVFRADRRCWIVQHGQYSSTESRWTVRDGLISFDNELSPFRRAYRFAAEGVGLVSPVETMRGEMKSENGIVTLVEIAGYERTRDRGD